MMKIITGYRTDQHKLIRDEEAHVAYYLFAHPDKRAILADGTVLLGADIRDIQPAYHEMMGWNPTHKMDDEDWNEIHRAGLERQMHRRMILARNVALRMSERHMSQPLPDVARALGLMPRIAQVTKRHALQETNTRPLD